MHAYSEYWKRLGTDNYNDPADEYMATGSGTLLSDVNVPDERLQQAVIAELHGDRGVDFPLVRVTVNRGTVLLKGYQNNTTERLAETKAAARVPGVKEIVNMLVIRTL